MSKIIPMVIMFLMSAHAYAYKLVEVPGGVKLPVKWGSAVLGSPAVIRFTIARERFDLEGGLPMAGCSTVGSMAPIMGAGRISEADFIGEIQAGLSRWSRIAGVRFVYVPSTAHADVVIGALAKDDPRPAYANMRLRLNEDAYVVEKGIVCLNPRYRFIREKSECGSSARNIAYVVSHEFGHIIGLDHPGSEGSLMAYRCSNDHVMTFDEEEGARLLYGPARER